MPAGQGEDAAERFAAAVELGRTSGFHADDDLERELEIVAMLRSREAAYQGAAFAPHPDARARARQRLMATFAEQHIGRAPVPSAAPDVAAAPTVAVSSETSRERTAPLSRVDARDRDVDAAELTSGLTPVDGSEPEPAAASHLAPVTDLAARAARRGGRHTMPTRKSGSPRLGRRFGLVSSAALLVMVALAGGGAFVSRDALPGDTLYGVKRAAEAAGLAATLDDEARARRSLQLAAVRLSEVERLVARDEPTGIDPRLVREAIQDFGVATSAGSQALLTDEDVAQDGGVVDLRKWAAAQAARLALLRPTLPVPAMADADSSLALLSRLVGRTDALEDRSDCSEVTSGNTDDLGPLPAEGACEPRPADPATEGSDDDDVTADGQRTSQQAGVTNGTGEPSEVGVPAAGTQLDRSGVPQRTTPSETGPTTATPRPATPGTSEPGQAPVVIPPIIPGMSPLTLS